MNRRRQRGEGKLGCLFTLALLVAAGGAAFKAVPVYYGNSELADACAFIATGASRKPVEAVQREVREKARELGVFEALADKGAIQVTKTGNGEVGTCTIRLHYSRVIDFYGLTQWTLVTDRTITRPIFESIS